MEEASISRRSFLTGAGGIAVLAGAAAATAAIPALGGADAFAEGLPATGAQAQDDVMAEYRNIASEPIAPLAVPANWDEEWDVIVVGSGGGLAGAMIAQEKGAKTLLLEKNDFYGGSSRESSTWLTAGTDFQLSLGMPDISAALHARAIAESPADPRYAANDLATAEAAKRLCNEMHANGFAWQPATVAGGAGPAGLAPAGTEIGGFAPRILWSCYDFLAERFKQFGGELRLGVKVVGLVMDGDRVAGVKAHTMDGGDAFIGAKKGVLLATGGMGANLPMLKRYIPSCYYRSKFSTSGTWDTGEGILMGLGAGGFMDGFDTYAAFDGGINGVDWNTYMYIAAVQISRQPWLGIDMFGARYPYHEGNANALFEAAEELARLPRHEGYVFFDSTYEELGDTFNQVICRRLIDADLMPGVENLPSYMVNPHWRDGVKEAIAKGLVIRSDSFDEIADALNLDRDVVKNAVADWNGMCEKGEDPEGLIAAEYLHPISKPPYYGMAVGEFVFATVCGLAVNDKNQVLNEKGKPIPGLYASGCTAGRFGGGSTSFSMYAAGSAYLAGENLADE